MKSSKTTRLRLLLQWSIFLLLLAGNNAFAQTKLSGTIINERTSAPASGATITVKNSNRSIVADEAGRFTINASTGDVLVITMVGYMKKEITVGKNNIIQVKLTESSSQLDDVVVIGYGKAKRKDLTGSITSISGEELRKSQPATFDQALQGKIAGAVVQQVSGQPGGGVSIQIRGVSSISGSNSPLYIIDGVIIPTPNDPGKGSNPLNTINPSEVESIDVLKDASATAIYGSQATNGVVVITTKRGRSSAPAITYDGYAGYQELPNKYDVVNLQQQAALLNDRAVVWRFDARPEFVNPKYLGKGTDWQEALFRKAPMQNHSLTVNGGDARTQYLFSASYFDQEGIALGSDFKRYSVRLNLDNKTTDWLKIGTSVQLVHVDENVNTTASNVIYTALRLTPDIAVKNPDGTWGGISNTSGWVQAVPNPVGLATLNKDKKKRDQVFGNAYAEIQFYKDLLLRNEVSGNFDFSSEDRFEPAYTFGKLTKSPNYAWYGTNKNIYTVVRNFLTYNHSFDKKSINALAGHEAQLSSYENVNASRTNFPSNTVQAIDAGDATTAKNGGGPGSGPALESYFGRLNFSLNDRYLLTGNLRGDGSSNFAPGRKWVYTYSGAFAWKLSNENFLQNVKLVNDLKLRVGYGITNNQGIPGNTFVTLLSSVSNGLSGSAQFQNNLANHNVTWEKTKYANAGLDGSLLNWKINFSLDVYNRLTDGLLLNLPLPFYSGTATDFSPGSMKAPYANVGSVRNRGFDLRISSTNINHKDFSWKTDFTVSHNENKVLSLGAGGLYANLSQVDRQSGGNYVRAKTVVGTSIGEFYGYVFDGIFAKPEDFQKHALPVDKDGEPLPISPNGGGIWYGDRRFKDLNGDGVIDDKDQTHLGSPMPSYQLGLNNSFTCKNFDFNIFFSANVGNKVLNQLAITQNNPINNTSYFTSVLNYARVALKDPNGSAEDVNNVYVTNPETSIVSLRNDNTNGNGRSSSLFIEDGSFLRCKNMTLGYRFPEKMLSKAHLGGLRVYMNVSNAFIITRYSGIDPEIGSWNPLQSGWDNGYYPQPRIFTFGANLSLSK